MVFSVACIGDTSGGDVCLGDPPGCSACELKLGCIDVTVPPK